MTLPQKSLNITSSYLLVETVSQADEFKEEEFPQWEEGISPVMTRACRILPLWPPSLENAICHWPYSLNSYGSNTNKVWETDHYYELLHMLLLFIFEGNIYRIFDAC